MGSKIGKLPFPYERLVVRSARKGYVPVLVGKEATAERFLVHVKQLNNPRMMMLLEMAAEELGHRHEGILRILCDADYFREMVDIKSK
jgi:Auxin responsive protein